MTLSQFEFRIPSDDDAVDEFEHWVTNEFYPAIKEAQKGKRVRALYLMGPLERHQVGRERDGGSVGGMYPPLANNLQVADARTR